MLNIRIIKSGFNTLLAHKLRAVFMVLGVVIGISALTVIISLGKGTEEKIMSQVSKLFSSNTVMIVAGSVDSESGPRSGNSLVKLKLEDIQALNEQVDNIMAWDAVQIAPDRETKFEGRNTLVTVSGQTSNLENVWDIELTSGRYFLESEDKNLARVALIGPNIKNELFRDDDPIGKQIRISDIPFQVIGVVAPRGMDPHGIDKDSEVIIPINTLLRRVVNLDYIMMGKVLLADVDEMESTVEIINGILRERHKLNENESSDFSIITPAIVKEMINSANSMFSVYLPLVAGIALLVGSIVVANLMLISVNERVFEIGLRKAVGANSKQILSQFLIESSAITIISGILGVGLGIIVLANISPILDLPFSVSWLAVIICLLIAIIIGIISGVYPARVASQMQPVESLK